MVRVWVPCKGGTGKLTNKVHPSSSIFSWLSSLRHGKKNVLLALLTGCNLGRIFRTQTMTSTLLKWVLSKASGKLCIGVGFSGCNNQKTASLRLPAQYRLYLSTELLMS